MSKKRKAGDCATKDVNLYCLCRQPNKENEMMVQCDFCDSWFHPRCVDVDEDEAEHLSSWNCPGCIDMMTENPSMTNKGLLAFQGRVAPKTGWVTDFLVTDIDERVLDEKIKTKIHRIEGYNLFREGKVSKLSCAKSESGKYVYLKCSCTFNERQRISCPYLSEEWRNHLKMVHMFVSCRNRR